MITAGFKQWFEKLFPNSSKTLKELEVEESELFLALTRVYTQRKELS